MKIKFWKINFLLVSSALLALLISFKEVNAQSKCVPGPRIDPYNGMPGDSDHYTSYEWVDCIPSPAVGGDGVDGNIPTQGTSVVTRNDVNNYIANLSEDQIESFAYSALEATISECTNRFDLSANTCSCVLSTAVSQFSAMEIVMLSIYRSYFGDHAPELQSAWQIYGVCIDLHE